VGSSFVAESLGELVFGWQLFLVLFKFGAARINALAARLRGIVRRIVRSLIGRCTRRRVCKREDHRHNLKRQQQQQSSN